MVRPNASLVACSVLVATDGAMQRESDYLDRLAMPEQLGVSA